MICIRNQIYLYLICTLSAAFGPIKVNHKMSVFGFDMDIFFSGAKLEVLETGEFKYQYWVSNQCPWQLIDLDVYDLKFRI